MAKDSGQTRVAGTGSVYIAPYGAALPSAYNAPLPSAYVELGYTTEEGVTFTDEPTIDRKGSWQSFYPTRILETARMAKVAFDLEQWNTDTLTVAAGGGTVSAAGSGIKFTPHAAGSVSEWTVVVDVTDGTISDRWVLPRALVVSALETQLNRADLAVMPVELEAIGEDGVNPWEFYSSDTTSFA
jgi:hypothetical protein